STRPVDRLNVVQHRSKLVSSNKMADEKSLTKEYGSYRNNLSYKEALLKTRSEQHKNVVDKGEKTKQREQYLDIEVPVEEQLVAWLKGCYVGQAYELEQVPLLQE
ncbi:hypothetical protein Ancab_012479, partial [Ancistrocladus abbreviatus]